MSWFLCTLEHSSQSLGELYSVSLPSTACAPALCGWSLETVASLGCCCPLETYRSHQRSCWRCSLLAFSIQMESYLYQLLHSVCFQTWYHEDPAGFSICVSSAVRWATPGPYGRLCIAMHWNVRERSSSRHSEWAVSSWPAKALGKMLWAMISGSFPHYPHRSF